MQLRVARDGILLVKLQHKVDIQCWTLSTLWLQQQLFDKVSHFFWHPFLNVLLWSLFIKPVPILNCKNIILLDYLRISAVLDCPDEICPESFHLMQTNAGHYILPHDHRGDETPGVLHGRLTAGDKRRKWKNSYSTLPVFQVAVSMKKKQFYLMFTAKHEL